LLDDIFDNDNFNIYITVIIMVITKITKINTKNLLI